MRVAILIGSIIISENLNPDYVPSDKVVSFITFMFFLFMYMDFTELFSKAGGK